MRKILFRAWDKDGNLWMPGGTNWVNVYSEEGYSASLSCFSIIEQFTGLQDRNGKPIYEGDSVKTRTLHEELWENSFSIYEVGFFQGTFCLVKNGQPVRQWKDGTHDWYSLENIESFEIEVIGNIHE